MGKFSMQRLSGGAEKFKQAVATPALARCTTLQGQSGILFLEADSLELWVRRPSTTASPLAEPPGFFRAKLEAEGMSCDVTVPLGSVRSFSLAVNERRHRYELRLRLKTGRLIILEPASVSESGRLTSAVMDKLALLDPQWDLNLESPEPSLLAKVLLFCVRDDALAAPPKRGSFLARLAGNLEYEEQAPPCSSEGSAICRLVTSETSAKMKAELELFRNGDAPRIIVIHNHWSRATLGRKVDERMVSQLAAYGTRLVGAAHKAAVETTDYPVTFAQLVLLVHAIPMVPYVAKFATVGQLRKFESVDMRRFFDCPHPEAAKNAFFEKVFAHQSNFTEALLQGDDDSASEYLKNVTRDLWSAPLNAGHTVVPRGSRRFSGDIKRRSSSELPGRPSLDLRLKESEKDIS